MICRSFSLALSLLQVTGLPPHGTDSDLERHFRTWGRVSSVEMVFDDEWIYEELEARGKLVMQAEEEVNLTLARMGEHFQAEMVQQWNAHVAASSAELLELVRQTAGSRNALAAFVIFGTVQDAAAAANAYLDYRNVVARGLKQPESLRLLGSRIKVH